jgi:hypothetical protein
MIPESIKRHKPGGTEIRRKNGHYYVYRVQGYYDKKAESQRADPLDALEKYTKG